MADRQDLERAGFRECRVVAKRLDIDHDGDTRGPFCRLAVDDTAPELPGVYAWVVDDKVKYVGKTDVLRQIVRGQRMNRAYNDYTYIPPSKVRQASSPRVRVNGLLNRAIVAGETVTWWWRECHSSVDAINVEARLIGDWKPEWNRAQPVGWIARDV